MESAKTQADAMTNTERYYPTPSVTVDAIVTKPNATGGH